MPTNRRHYFAARDRNGRPFNSFIDGPEEDEKEWQDPDQEDLGHAKEAADSFLPNTTTTITTTTKVSI
jgi:hypothetical protein